LWAQTGSSWPCWNPYPHPRVLPSSLASNQSKNECNVLTSNCLTRIYRSRCYLDMFSFIILLVNNINNDQIGVEYALLSLGRNWLEANRGRKRNILELQKRLYQRLCIYFYD
jgi:hypothetical protein